MHILVKVVLHFIPSGHVDHILQGNFYFDGGVTVVERMEKQYAHRHEQHNGHEGNAVHGEECEYGDAYDTADASIIGGREHKDQQTKDEGLECGEPDPPRYAMM